MVKYNHYEWEKKANTKDHSNTIQLNCIDYQYSRIKTIIYYNKLNEIIK